ncbi:Holliday junction resolvase RuvX [Fundidesulfovibrio terrae]|uniref:Holliday junction resolvase RuvX n=1 Tax=Fundidesulfovibrio terrae TaxID=2922866 RepID=UPI001FAE7650|nr:Holliday junction resolvase RuvX [Fundidesulfovibrio terrae]
MRVLGVDFGLKRVGLALSDPGGSMAFPHKTVERTEKGGREALFSEIAGIVASEFVELVVVGWPAPAEGRDSLTARQAANFAASLARRVAVPVKLMDETLSSEEALDDLRAAGLKASKRKAALDQQAAVRILQSYLGAPEAARDVTAQWRPQTP